MKPSNTRVLVLGAAALTALTFLGGCAVSPDYSHYDWNARGGMVDEQDRALAGARIEPFQSRRGYARSHADEQLTPPGAPTPREAEVIIDPTGETAPPPRVTTTRTRTVVLR
jgi:hypothetical protein